MIKVIKRDGAIKDFSFERIEIAIRSCYEDVYGELDKKELREIEDIMDNIIDYINFGIEDDSISVEEIQSIVVENLKQINKTIISANNFEAFNKSTLLFIMTPPYTL